MHLPETRTSLLNWFYNVHFLSFIGFPESLFALKQTIILYKPIFISMHTKFKLLVVLLAITLLSCESDSSVLPVNDSQKNRLSSRFDWDSYDDYNDPSDSSFLYDNFIYQIQGKWTQLLGENGQLTINGNLFHFEDPEFDLNLNGNFFINNETGSFSNGNVFDYVVNTPTQRTHLQMILENNTILRIGIFVKKNGSKQKSKVVVYQKVNN